MLRKQPLNPRVAAIRSGQLHIRPNPTDLAAKRLTGVDYGLDNFSYDPDYLSAWRMPEALTDRLPQHLLDAVGEWQLAGAAVGTALERIKELDAESIYRGFPLQNIQHLLRRPGPDLRTVAHIPYTDTPQSMDVFPDTPESSNSYTDTPLTSCPVSPTTFACFPPMPDPMRVKSSMQPLSLGIDSPPMTPVDSLVSSTPAEHICLTDAALPDADALAGRLSPLFRHRLDSISSVSGCSTASSDRLLESPPSFDLNAWDTYANAYRAEVDDLRRRVWPRFRGAAFTVRKARLDDPDEDVADEDLERFDSWWETVRSRIVDCEVAVSAVRVPSVEGMMEERAKRGLPV